MWTIGHFDNRLFLCQLESSLRRAFQLLLNNSFSFCCSELSALSFTLATVGVPRIQPEVKPLRRGQTYLHINFIYCVSNAHKITFRSRLRHSLCFYVNFIPCIKKFVGSIVQLLAEVKQFYI